MSDFSAAYRPTIAALALAAAATASAAPLDPLAYASLGALSLGAGNYTLDTGGALPRLLDASATVLFVGVLQVQADAFNPWVAVFDFDSVTIAAGAVITASGNNPVALLSRSGLNFAGTLDAAGRNGGNQNAGLGGRGGPGGGAGGTGGGGEAAPGGGPGGGAGGYPGLGNGSWGEGGAYGGLGSNWNPARTSALPYGDPRLVLQGGSGGGASGANLFGAGGGGGGGGVEFGALDFIFFSGGSKLLVHGGLGGDGLAVNAGGGSGGGALVHAPLVTLESSNLGPSIIDASGMSGGRISFLTGDATVAGNLASVSVGASFWGQVGVITYSQLSAVPEPAPAALLAAGLLALALRGRKKAG